MVAIIPPIVPLVGDEIELKHSKDESSVAPSVQDSAAGDLTTVSSSTSSMIIEPKGDYQEKYVEFYENGNQQHSSPSTLKMKKVESVFKKRGRPPKPMKGRLKSFFENQVVKSKNMLKCTPCGKSYLSRAYMRLHVLKVHLPGESDALNKTNDDGEVRKNGEHQESPPPSPASTLFENAVEPKMSPKWPQIQNVSSSIKAKRGRPRKGEIREKNVYIKKDRKAGSGRPPGSTKKVKIFFETHVERRKGGVLHCTKCGESSQSRSDMYYHIQKVHCANICSTRAIFKMKNFECKYCHYRSSFRHGLQQHLKSTHKAYHFECSLCDYWTNKRIDLSMHKKANHKALRSCRYCDYDATSQEMLIEHIMTNVMTHVASNNID